MNQLIALLDGALQANLSKRQWAAFAVVLRQTLGYRKTEDDLSARRFEQLSGIRRNHIWQAKNELVSMGLLQSRAGQYGEVLRLANSGTVPIVSPSSQMGNKGDAIPVSRKSAIPSPKAGQPTTQIGPESVPKQDTTLSNLTQSNHYSTVGRVVNSDVSEVEIPVAVADEPGVSEAATNTGLQYPPQLSSVERAKAPRQLDGLTPQAAQQVLDVWALKIARGEVRKSRLGLLAALVKAQRQGQLHTDGLHASGPASGVDPQQQQRLQAREHWLEQQAQHGWLRDMAKLSGLPPDQMPGGISGLQSTGGAP